MRKTHHIAVVLGLVISTWPNLSWAKRGCKDLDFSTTSSVDFTMNGTQQISITVSRDKRDKGCDYFLTFSRGSASDYHRTMLRGADSFPYQLYKAYPFVDVLKDFSDITSERDYIGGSFPDDSGTLIQTIYYQAVLGTAAYRPVGLYNDSITVSLYEDQVGDPILRKTRTVNYRYNVARSIDLSLVPSGGAFNPNDTAFPLTLSV